MVVKEKVRNRRKRGSYSARSRGFQGGQRRFTRNQLFRGGNVMKETTAVSRRIKVGVITDQTGPLSFAGIADANVARMVINDINARGGLLGRKVDLCLEDSATTDSVAAAKATKLVEQDRVDVILGGIYSSTRQAIKDRSWRKARRFTFTRSSTREGNRIRSSSALARCRRSSWILSFPG
jgi:ABC-type branched-subunit amino acid transport system substrate-binding protein